MFEPDFGMLREVGVILFHDDDSSTSVSLQARTCWCT